MEIIAPAKINLILRVLGKRGDGYHELESVMQQLTIADVLRIEDDDELRFTCSEPALAGPDNLVMRAARLLCRHCAVRRGARIHLEKHVPVQAGLGGGSSDAATALSALNEFWKLHLTLDELKVLAAELGSDVPFFLNGPSAVVRGRGEEVTPFTHDARCHIVLAKPSAGLSTPQVYANLHASSLPQANSSKLQQETSAMLSALQVGDCARIARALVNDLQEPAFALLPELARLRECMLAQGCLGVLLCGSGSTLFGICPDEATARHAELELAYVCSWAWSGAWGRSEH